VKKLSDGLVFNGDPKINNYDAFVAASSQLDNPSFPDCYQFIHPSLL
jgi:hypothetical protein